MLRTQRTSIHRSLVPRTFGRQFQHRIRANSTTASRPGRRVLLPVAACILGVTGIYSYLHFNPVSAEAPQSNDVLLKSTSTPSLRARKSIDTFQPRQIDVDVLLREHEQSHTPPPGSGVLRYDTCQTASNQPTEDDHAEEIGSKWSFFASLDGHSGWETSAYLRETLIPFVKRRLEYIHNVYAPEVPSADIIDTVIKYAFVELDDIICKDSVEEVFKMDPPSRTAATAILAPAWSGSCALLCMYDKESRVLRTAVTGDSRALLARKRPDGSFDVHVLSIDQDGENPLEEARINAEHPGETPVNKQRVLGMGISRAFGDAPYKWSLDIQKKLFEGYLGNFLRGTVKTPPYLTAEPEIIRTKIEPGDVLIMATDGISECLTNEEVVGLVGSWMNKTDELPSVHPEGGFVGKWDNTRYPLWHEKKRFVTVDENAATHIIRNAAGVLPPRSRSFIDDIQVTVVFFE
ncbi:protein serine/threonine phosphatase 2C [Sistotremastrum niveocremeum HHB9708]|uniref:Protein serine/threonine phosphatase 2C n=1 Tax=Sistotremastrum niveocremeum HHB9708 TaxID=1314777 RepID=A0A164VSA3_9AGAM|nr:protein serine/threonine phosphatase 2C [Sistotremastrum niveocremeum HHB9708]